MATSIEIGSVVQEWTGDDGESYDLMAYIQVQATLDGRPITLGTMVGVPEAEQGTCRAAGSGVRPFLSTWWADSSDWQDVPADRREEAEGALFAAARRLWREAMALRTIRTAETR